MVCVCNASAVEVGAGGPIGLTTCQSSLLGKFQANERLTSNKKRWIVPEKQLFSSFCGHVHTCAPVHIDEHTHMHTQSY